MVTRSAFSFLAVLCLAANLPAETVQVSMGHPDLHIYGALKTSVSDRFMYVQRFPDAVLGLPRDESGFNPDKARTHTGVSLAFVADSPFYELGVRVLPGENRGGEMAVYADGELLDAFTFPGSEESVQLAWNSPAETNMVLYEVTFPSWAEVSLAGLWMDGSANMLNPYPEGRPQFAVLGDSISHGTGQGSATHKTWPWILGRKLGLALVNLAVGGGGISKTAAETLSEYRDLRAVIVLVGYNDWQFAGKSAGQITEDYEDMLLAAREAVPGAPIFCITPVYTRKDRSEKTGLSLAELREAIEAAVRKASAREQGIFLLHGEDLSGPENLRADKPDDPVHFGEEGAAKFAEDLYREIDSRIVR